jgi:hypothetical protein
MDKIQVKKNKSIYKIYEKDFFDIFINGEPLHSFLNSKYPDNNLRGLVPPFDGWLINEQDEDILWDRLIPETGKSSILPILICPDDQDYLCSTVVTNVVSGHDTITWRGFGLDSSDAFNKPDLVGTKVNWFNNSDSLIFDKKEYAEAIKQFL